MNAQLALPFINPKSFDAVFEKIYNSLKTGGILTGQFFGDRDGWTDDPNMSFTSRAEAEKILGKFKVLLFQEDEKDKETAGGEMKHWHVFSFIVEK